MDTLEKEVAEVLLSGQQNQLKGRQRYLSSCPKVKVRKLKGLIRKGGIAQMIHLCQVTPPLPPDTIPMPVQQLVDSQAHLFKDLDSLPPSREFDHQIPLIPGVKPVNVKPYRYSPTQKDEIER